MKYCVVILDGLADRTYGRIKNQTPLEIARTPGMNKIAAEGRLGMVKTIAEGMPAESLVAVMSILGYDPVMYYSGTAPFEARRLGISLENEDACFCCDLVSTFEGAIVDARAGKIHAPEVLVLLDELQKYFMAQQMELHPVAGHHNLLILRGKSFPHFKSQNPWNILGKPMADYAPTDETLRRILTDTHEILKDHEINKVRRDLNENPADSLWLWGLGKLPYFPPFEELRHKKAALLTASPAIQGLAQEIGIHLLEIPDASVPNDAFYQGTRESTLSALSMYELVFLHLGVLVEVSREGDLNQKIRTIEKIDELVIAPLRKSLQTHERILVVGGHFVSVGEKTSESHRVPFTMGGPDYPVGTNLTFNEKNAQKVDLYLKDGTQLLPLFLQK